ncbi:hypothetical protein CTA1_2809 [Colletotrichum tanaceti]|uniref:Uncharacterized protein n=1 Tax=Colletotrichum tanaceti TaxID=1306861 RepID=A0A4U6X836_9PEZI|nr:hypothetical protein CTA1_2809 [Colletotrichum tanaceti]
MPPVLFLMNAHAQNEFCSAQHYIHVGPHVPAAASNSIVVFRVGPLGSRPRFPRLRAQNPPLLLPVRQDAPPSVDGVAPQVHARQHDAAEDAVLVPHRVVAPGEEGGLAGVDGAGPVVGGEDDGGRGGARRVPGRHQHHGRRGDAGDADEVGDEVPLPAEQVRQRRPEERRHDAHGGHARRVVVELRHAVLADRVALHVEPEQRVGAEGLGLARDDPEHDEAPPVPRGEDLFGEPQRQRRPFLDDDDGHPGAREGLFVLAEVEGGGRVRRVREAEEAVEGDGQGHEAVDDEEPAPAAEAAQAVHAGVDAGLDEAAEEGAGEARGGEDAAALAELAPRVPGAEDVLFLHARDVGIVEVGAVELGKVRVKSRSWPGQQAVHDERRERRKPAMVSS